MSVQIDTLTYIDPSLPLHQDLAWFRKNVADLNVAHVWIELPRPAATDPEVLRAVDRFQDAIESNPEVIAAIRADPPSCACGATSPDRASGCRRIRRSSRARPQTSSRCCSPNRGCAATSTSKG